MKDEMGVNKTNADPKTLFAAQKRKKATIFGGVIFVLIMASFLINFLKNINLGLNDMDFSFLPFGSKNLLLVPFSEKPGFGFLQELKEKAAKREIEFSAFSPIGENAIEASSSSGTTVFFSKEKEVEPQLDTLQTIWENFKIEGRRARIIDLRYERPIIVP